MPAALERLAAAHAMLPVRRTTRLVLRPFQEADREPFAALNADPEVAKYLKGPLTRAESDATIDRLRLGVARCGFGMFALEERGSRAFVGMVGLWAPDWVAPFTPTVEIAWRLAPAFQHQGLAEEAARDTLLWAFGKLHLPRIVSFTVPENVRSWRLMERLGMARAGTFEHPALEAGHPLRTHVLYALDAPVVELVPPAARRGGHRRPSTPPERASSSDHFATE